MAVHELFAYLRAKPAEEAAAFYREVFGAREKFRLVDPGGRIGHMELLIGGTVLMLSDEWPEYDIYAPEPDRPSGFLLHLHVDDADALIERAVAAGARLIRPLQDHFYGERSGTIRDPFGYDWLIGHAIEEVAPEEIQRRFTEMMTAKN